MPRDLIEKYKAPVPRYTSYPTAPHFSADVTTQTYRNWLSDLPDNARLSLYAHIPFCSTLCYFCGCHTRGVNTYTPVAAYVDTICAEIDLGAAAVRADHTVTHIHWGGGSPDILSPADIVRLAAKLRGSFNWDADAEFAVEIDPRELTDERVAAFAEAGVNRASIGVQDFNEEVQKAINRIQGFELTKSSVDRLRVAGIDDVNIDLVYGLPHQTTERVLHTIEKSIELRPQRIALFGYAHLPQRLKRQRLIPDAALPGPGERFEQTSRMAVLLEAAGYVRIGLDHFALETDDLAIAARNGTLRRNFQGYTTDTADALIGFGASAIGEVPQGFVANATDVPQYRAMIEAGQLPVTRGYARTRDDRIRAYAIERLMCDLAFPAEGLIENFGPDAETVLAEARAYCESETDGLIEKHGGTFTVTERGRPFVRNICATFDAHLARSTAQHSAGV